MTIDQLARHIHRRGVLAVVAALVVPAKAGAQAWTCREQGEGCTLLIPCCSGECVTLPFNPNAGICGTGTPDDDDDGDDRDVLTCEEAAREYGGLPVRPTCPDFECQEDAQDFFDFYFPDDPCGLDGVEGPTTNGRPNVACEDRPTCGFQRAHIKTPRQRRRRLRRLRRRMHR